MNNLKTTWQRNEKILKISFAILLFAGFLIGFFTDLSKPQNQPIFRFKEAEKFNPADSLISSENIYICH